jgi:signal transduction histidine kinase
MATGVDASAAAGTTGETPSGIAVGRGMPALRPRLERARTPGGGGDRLGVPWWMERLLRLPLPAKLVGANLVLLVAGVSAGLFLRQHTLEMAPLVMAVVGALVVALLVNVALVTLAVRPIDVLGRTVDRIWRGDLDARVPESRLADRDVARVGRMFNILLDGLIADRARTRRLASELVHAEDRERAAIARELHDSVAQSLAALVMQLSAAVRAVESAPAAPPAGRDRLVAAHELATNVLEEIRLLAHTMHPRVLDDLGLVAALRRLARETNDHASVEVDFDAAPGSEGIRGGTEASVLYRVAQEAVQNAQRHAHAELVVMRLAVEEGRATLEVTDDGRGFDVERALQEHEGMGLFTMEERVSLVDGTFHVMSQPGHGTTVIATVPLHERAALAGDGPGAAFGSSLGA